MAQRRGARITLLVEDEMIERLARSVLTELGFGRRELYIEPYPVGHGSGRQWVDQEFSRLVRAYRSQANHQRVCLLVGTDADEFSVVDRRTRLELSLASANLGQREESERVAFWIPRWNVETWLLALAGLEADEDDKDSKNRLKTPDFPSISKEFVRQLRAYQRHEPLQTLPSLGAAYAETLRLL
jgi:hypothetical protein